MNTNLTTFFIMVLVSIFISCQNEAKHKNETQNTNQVYMAEYQQIIDSANVRGTILIHDYNNDIYYSNDFQWANRGQLPASTFKIPNTIIGIETGVIHPDTTVFRWDKKPRALEMWQRDLDLHEAFHFSCVPCYQEVARKIGVKRMQAYLSKLEYGSMIVDSNNLDKFWLEGESKITPLEHIDFLVRFYFNDLPIAESTVEEVKKIMLDGQIYGANIYSKTGWAIRNGLNSGWYVGFAEKNGRVWFFAVNIEPKPDFNMDEFPAIRKIIALKALKFSLKE